jgi:hypothetical protein
MPLPSHPLRFLLVAIAGWIHQQQRDVIDYLQEENRVLREQLGPRRLRFTDDQCIRLAAKARKLPGRMLYDSVSVVTPDTLLRQCGRQLTDAVDGFWVGNASCCTIAIRSSRPPFERRSRLRALRRSACHPARRISTPSPSALCAR